MKLLEEHVSSCTHNEFVNKRQNYQEHVSHEANSVPIIEGRQHLPNSTNIQYQISSLKNNYISKTKILWNLPIHFDLINI
jgi:hypothetical protein